MPTRCGSVCVCVQARSQMFLARSSSAAVNGLSATPSMVLTKRSRAALSGWSAFSTVEKTAKPGSARARAEPFAPAARRASMSALLKRKSGPPRITVAKVSGAKSGEEPAGT